MCIKECFAFTTNYARLRVCYKYKKYSAAYFLTALYGSCNL